MKPGNGLKFSGFIFAYFHFKMSMGASVLCVSLIFLIQSLRQLIR